MKNFQNILELLNYTEKIKGKKFKEFDKDNILNVTSLRDKGILGKLIETEFYKYPNNSNAKADFDNLGVELKVTGFKRNKTGKGEKAYAAKERLTLGKINYMQIINEEFEFSKLLFKNKKILIIWYKYEENTNYADMEITDYQLYDLSQDEEIIRNDFYIIKEMVVKGEAHNISEGQTSYLGACIKAATSADRTPQPNNNKSAKPRAFCLKNSYMTGIFRTLLSGNQINTEKTTFMTTKEYVFNILKHYIGKTQIEIYNMITGKDYTNKIPKNISKMISDRLIGRDDELEDKHELFKKTTYIIKNLPIFPNKKPVERMSFRNLKISEFEKDWEESDWKQYFEEVTLLIICYEAKDKNVKNGYRKLKEIKTISFTDEDIEEIKKGYKMVQNAINKNDISLLPYPNSYENQIIEIAPKGEKGDDAYNNFFKKDTTKTTFMLSKDFLEKKLKNN